uniref:Ig-like domain-containing protein n=1 Tax=Maylandia zebra TaxID=106582 RepID=A0A3P9BH90_9CICH
LKTFSLVHTLVQCVNVCWISVLAFEFHYVEVQPGEEVTLQCSNLSRLNIRLFWFRSTNRPSASRISSMVSPESSVTFYEGFQNVKFNMTSNISVLFLEIEQVDSSDSGLYFCGELKNEMFIVYGATNLKVQGKLVFFSIDSLTDSSQNPSTMILGSLTVFLLLVIIGLIVKIRKFHTAEDDGQNPQRSEVICLNRRFRSIDLYINVDSGAMNYAALSFPLRTKIRRSAPQRELEPNVVYAATR